MSVIATAVRHLLAAGVTGEALVAAIADMEASQPVDAVAEKRRAYDRERKRALKSTGIPPETAESTENPSPSPSSSPDPSNNPTPTHGEIPRARKASACRLPESWNPEPLGGDVAKASAAWPPGALDRELARFRDWAASASGANARKSDWQAAWRNWVRKADDEGRYRNDQLRSNRGPASKSNDGFLNAIRESGERRRAANG